MPRVVCHFNKQNGAKNLGINSRGDCTVVGDNINIIKTTFELNFDFYQSLNSMDKQKYEKKEAVNLKSFTLITCKLVMRKKLNN